MDGTEGRLSGHVTGRVSLSNVALTVDGERAIVPGVTGLQYDPITRVCRDLFGAIVLIGGIAAAGAVKQALKNNAAGAPLQSTIISMAVVAASSLFHKSTHYSCRDFQILAAGMALAVGGTVGSSYLSDDISSSALGEGTVAKIVWIATCGFGTYVGTGVPERLMHVRVVN